MMTLVRGCNCSGIFLRRLIEAQCAVAHFADSQRPIMDARWLLRSTKTLCCAFFTIGPENDF
jgi:hypothetical protein